MTNSPRSRQELYDQIRSVGKTEFIYEEMVRLGFWRGAHPRNIASADQARKVELQRQLSALRTEQTRLSNTEALMKEARKRRMAESRERQKATKVRRARERQARADAWAQRKTTELLYLGSGVSGALNDVENDVERLRSLGLPPLGAPPEIAAAMGISLGELRFLSFGRPVSQVSHYVRFSMPKKTGGERVISAPMPRLKRAQRWIYDNLLHNLPIHDAAHGFRPGRSIVSNARPHVGADVVVNLDLKDFFPSLTYARVWGVFRSLGYSRSASTVFAMLTTEPEAIKIEIDGRLWHVALGDRFLPQGAPTSPAITNWACRRLDKRLTDLAAYKGFSSYTRYADDLTFSGGESAKDNVGSLLGNVRTVVSDEGFVVHPDKTRILRKGRRQEVTGLVVNARPNVPRKTLRRFRATLFQIEKDGPEGKTWGQSDDVISSIEGFANFVYMVDPSKGAAYKAQVERIIDKYGRGTGRPTQTAPQPSAQAPTFNDLPTETEVPIEVPTYERPYAPAAPEPPAPIEPIAPIDTSTDGGDDGDEGADGDKKWWKMW